MSWVYYTFIVPFNHAHKETFEFLGSIFGEQGDSLFVPFLSCVVMATVLNLPIFLTAVIFREDVNKLLDKCLGSRDSTKQAKTPIEEVPPKPEPLPVSSPSSAPPSVNNKSKSSVSRWCCKPSRVTIKVREEGEDAFRIVTVLSSATLTELYQAIQAKFETEANTTRKIKRLVQVFDRVVVDEDTHISSLHGRQLDVAFVS